MIVSVVALTAVTSVAQAATSVSSTSPSDPRIAPLAAQLRSGPLAVDPDLRWVFSPAQERAVIRTLGRAVVPFHVALVPQLSEDPSGGDPERIDSELHHALGRPGIYLALDGEGDGSIRSYDVNRDGTFDIELPDAPANDPHVGATTARQIQAVVRKAATLPVGHSDDTDLDQHLLAISPASYAAHTTPAATRLLRALGIGLALGLALCLPAQWVTRRRHPGPR